MFTIATIGLLSGAALGLRFRVRSTIPAAGLVAALTIVTATGAEWWDIVPSLATAIIAPQIGYFAAAFMLHVTPALAPRPRVPHINQT